MIKPIAPRLLWRLVLVIAITAIGMYLGAWALSHLPRDQRTYTTWGLWLALATVIVAQSIRKPQPARNPAAKFEHPQVFWIISGLAVAAAVSLAVASATASPVDWQGVGWGAIMVVFSTVLIFNAKREGRL